MPFPRMWSEEIVAEWLHLEGYVVETNMPIAVHKHGSRFEVDVAGAKKTASGLEIHHIEVGSIAGGPNSARAMMSSV